MQIASGERNRKQNDISRKVEDIKDGGNETNLPITHEVVLEGHQKAL